MKYQVIAFDADDTLWVNEPNFQEAERQFCALLEDFLPQHTVSRELLKTEIKNLDLYGYGVKSFMLSMIETAMNVTAKTVSLDVIEKSIQFGRELLEKPVDILDGVEEVLSALHGRYRLVMATKGDLLDQERKLKKSGLERFFHHIEIMSDKKEADYRKLLRHLDIAPEAFLMIGNSIKSDVLPVLEIGGHGIHVPYHITWEHEKVEVQIDNPRFRQVDHIREILPFLRA
ncbi:MAG: HAD family hydrolase [Saprospiraceae bacterium]|nr:HAD family hydrolase [Saprospiraceae bacterium]